MIRNSKLLVINSIKFFENSIEFSSLKNLKNKNKNKKIKKKKTSIKLVISNM